MLKQRKDLLDFSLQLAKTAGEKIMPFYQNCIVNTKEDGSDVTEADRCAEGVVREMITKHFSDYSILGEEFGENDNSNSRFKWVIDPLDGTTWFTLGVPIFGTLIGLLEDNEPIIGVIHFPATNETIFAGKGLGCWFIIADSKPVQIHVDSIASLDEAVVSAAGVHSSNIYAENGQVPYNMSDLIHRAKKFRFCGDCLQHTLVSRGRIHAAVDTLMQPWDIAAIVPCIEEAGGIATSLSGHRKDIVFGGSLLSSCSLSLHRELLKLLNSSEI